MQAAELAAQLGAARAKIQALEDRLATPTPPKPAQKGGQAKTPLRTAQEVGGDEGIGRGNGLCMWGWIADLGLWGRVMG